MFILACTVQIGSYLINQVNEIEIRGSVENVGQSATIKLPNLTNILAESAFKEGDQVRITLKYLNDQMVEVYSQEEFTGQVSKISPKRPLEVTCEDGIYFLKRKNINESWKDVKLDEVVRYIVKDTPIKISGEIPDVELERFSIQNTNAAQALNQLKEAFGFQIYLRGNDLFAGLAFTELELPEASYEFGRNIVSDDLTFIESSERKLNVTIKSILKDNTVLEETIGDEDGQKRTVTVYNIKDQETLKMIANEELSRLKYTGYEGSITAFLPPYSTYGSRVNITDPINPERQGSYVVEKVDITFGQRGARRKVFLGVKIS